MKLGGKYLVGGLAGGLTAVMVGSAIWHHLARQGPQPEPDAQVGPPPARPSEPAERRASRPAVPFPARGKSAEEVLQAMDQLRAHDARWREGKTWSLVYHLSDESAEFAGVTGFLQQAHSLFFSENGLNPMAFPSLKRFEAEVVAMTADLLGGDEHTAGNMTSGGTESILMAVLTAREWARARDPANTAPEMILPRTAHPAFEKAGHYFGVQPVHIPVGADFRADVEAARAAINPHTILLVGSAPSYPQGVIDPIAELAAIAGERGLLCHVDACVGGFMLPFVRKLGYPLPDFDFRVPGVTSMSADLHKYAYAAKGASVILYRDRDLRRHQFFAYTDWPGGLYASPTMAGTRPAGPIAAAWAILNHLGQAGYLCIADTVMRTTSQIKAGVAAIDGVHVLGEPAMSILALGSERLNVYEIGDELAQRGWHFDRQQTPPSLHLTVTHAHAQIADRFLADLEEAVARARRFSLQKLSNSAKVGLVQAAARLLPPDVMSALSARASALAGLEGGAVPQRSAAMYGMMASLPNRGDLEELVLDVLDQLTDTDRRP
jgi:glutamate/tyrosine decarboxylase-like PLP-dependent enzyme